jgi:hypothetical protein
MKLIRMFGGAGATGHVFLLKSGTRQDVGLAYSGLIGPWTTPAVVPTTTQILDFSIPTRTKDEQAVVITGNIKITLDPGKAIDKFDFTVTTTGNYTSEWQPALQATITEKVLGPTHDEAKNFDVKIATKSHKKFEDAIMSVLKDSSLVAKGINVESCSIANITAVDSAISGAIGAKEKEELLTGADKARHDRQMKASENSRAVRAYDAETELNLAKDKEKLIEQESKNTEAEAKAKAAATKIELDVTKEIEPVKLLGIALLNFSKEGSVNTLNIDPALIATLKSSVEKN